MPTISRIFIKSAMLWFALALATAGAMTFAPAELAGPLLPTYLHMFVVGWVTQMIFGVAIWLFPRFTKEKPRGAVWLLWLALVALNVGLILRAVAEPGRLFWPHSAWNIALVASALSQWLGGMAFVLNIWPRVKATR